MDIKEEMDVKDVCLLDTVNKYFLSEAQYNAIAVKLEEGPADLSEASLQNGSLEDIKEAIIDIEPTVLLDSTNGIFINESKYSNIKFDNKLTHKTHLLLHTDERPFKCGTCLATFKQKGHLKRHFVTHSNKHPFKCEICHGKFKLKENLNNHLLIHSGKYNFECYICQEKFKRKAYLKIHLVTHYNKFNFKCDLCDKKFKRKIEVKQHLVTHSEIYNFGCDICHRKFKRKYGLLRHLNKHSIKRGKNKDIKKKLIILLHDCTKQ